jgi:hypothetical protein
VTTSDESGLAVRGEEPKTLQRGTPATVAGTQPEGTAGPPATSSRDGGSDAAGPAPADGGRARRPVRTALLVAAAIAVAAAAGTAASGTFGSDGEDSANTAPAGPPATTEVRRTTLTDTETVDGGLGYGDATEVQAPASPASPAGTGSGSGGQGSGSGGGSADAGVLTWLPTDGTVLERGDTVYRVGREKVPLLYGSMPLYRTLRTGDEGEDVKILEKNLKALGYQGFTVDDTFTSDTADAVKEWQQDLDREETGTVRVGDAVVASGARRVAEVTTVPGALLSGSPLSWTATDRIVTVDLDPQYEDLVKKGTKATVTLPDDSTVEAVVTDVGTPPPARSGDSGSGSSGGDAGQSGGGSDTATIPVQLEIKEQKKLGRYQAAQVDVVLKAETRENVLAVPVNALTARRGGYALEAVTGKDVAYVPVKLGMFAGGLVEVTGADVREGMAVGVPE